MFSKNNKISSRQMQILLILDIFGTGVIALSGKAAAHAGQDGWIIVVIITLAALLFTFIITTAGGMFGDSFVGFTSKVLTKPVGTVVCIILAVKLMLNTAMELRLFGEVVKVVMLRDTPIWAVSGGMLLLGAYAAHKGYETRARVAEILFLLMFAPLIIMLCIGCFGVDFTNMLPIAVAPAGSLLVGSFNSLSAFNGLELLLLVFPYAANPKNVRNASLKAVLFTGMCMIIITIITIAKFGPLETGSLMWPTLDMIDTINLPGSFIERLDALAMSFWIISVFAITNAGLFFTSVILDDMTGKNGRFKYLVICSLIIFIVSYLPKDVEQVYEISNLLFHYLGLAYIAVIPILLLIAASLRERLTR